MDPTNLTTAGVSAGACNNHAYKAPQSAYFIHKISECGFQDIARNIFAFLPIEEALAFDLETGSMVEYDLIQLLDKASKTLPGVSESTPILSRISALFSRIRHYDPSIKKDSLFSDMKEKLKHLDQAALLDIARDGDSTILKLYLENKTAISENDRGLAIKEATSFRSGHETIVSLLLDNGPISDEHKREAIEEASKAGYEGILSLLLDNHQTVLSDEDRGRIVSLALLYEEAAVLPLLLDNGSISEVDRGKAVCRAVLDEQADVLPLLLNNGPISDADRGHAVYLAVTQCYHHNQLAIIPLLLASGSISDADRDRALGHATQYGDKDIVSLLSPPPKAYLPFIRINFDTGFGNSLSIRSAPDWAIVHPMECLGGSVWQARTPLPEGTEYKICFNGTVWEEGSNRVAGHEDPARGLTFPS